MNAIAQVAAKLKAAHKTIVLSGAGLSAESGVPTFRGSAGIWKSFDPMQLATPEAFAENPALVWEFYNERRHNLLSFEPNAAHIALAELERVTPAFLHVTQNVDGLAARAGGEKILELHGSLFDTICSECRSPHPHLRGEVPFPSTCQRCGGLVRPGVVWFGEPVDRIGHAAQEIHDSQMLIVVGTSGVVQPAASLVVVAKRQGAFVVEINLERTPVSKMVDEFLPGKAGEVLPLVVAAMRD
jgi:NAD-dependent protein deacetylase/lipoamidase